MKTVLCENTEWLLSEEAFSIYASCMYHPTYEEYKAQMEDYLHDSSEEKTVVEYSDGSAVRYNCVLYK